ncbi:MAG TPA: arginine--tRNA ligase [Steroidobacteraceae bacterium]|nr:arginine--tRNA ligase [Steroidobacteraceae bacterium]
MKDELSSLVARALSALDGTLLRQPVPGEWIVIERTRDASHGDYSCNIALRLAKLAGRPPRVLAEAIRAAIPQHPAVVAIEVAGAGFINFRLARAAHSAVLRSVLEQAGRYGCSDAGRGESVLLEFVSANPTGPLHVGHGRQAAYGATLANLLRATGHRIEREYYINDGGRQMEILTVSAWLRYLELCGEPVAFPANGYRGEYVRALGAQLHAQRGSGLVRSAAQLQAGLPPDAPAGDKDRFVDALIARMRELLGDADFEIVLGLALAAMLADIREDLAGFGVHFDHWSSERELFRSGAVEHAIARLEQAGALYRQDGALWFRASRFGDDEDRVLVRANGQKTYFAPDIAYHLHKRERGYARLIDVLGADHHGYVARLRGALVAMGEPGACLEACLIQFVSLFRAGEKIPMGKREGQFVTLRQLREEVGNDACRLFFLMRSHDQPLDFDLELAKARSNENPVYYIQYAHARVASVMKQLGARGLDYDAALALRSLAHLEGEHEQAVLAGLARYPEIIGQAAAARAPHALVHFLRELANLFHTWYNAATFIVEDAALRNARLALALGVQQVVRNGLDLLGVSAPESM